MELVADLHIHSHYSRATSRDLTLEHLARWAQLKGVHIVGTGDIAHPGWLAEMRDKLVPAEEGLFRLKDEDAIAAQTPAACQAPVRFILAGEISNIYKRDDAVRKVHHILFAPTLEAVARLQAQLEKIGNIRADGRPILGLDSRDLLEILLEVDERCCLIPAHIWTPWFSLLGSKSGFDSVEACFADLTPHIFALETGLSSDPPMNWRVSMLDRYTLVSNSDAHSPQKLAREATVFYTEPAYDALLAALRSGDPSVFGGTLEFFPEEGKYHLDGHRKCGVCWEPPTTLAHEGRCPVCGKPVTVGVMHRVEVLADRPPGARPPRAHPYTHLIPLPEVLGEVHQTGAGSRKVQQEMEKLLARLGPELAILRTVPLEEIRAVGGDRLAEAIRRMRAGEVVAEGGYDGEYGVIRIFARGMAAEGTPQLGLFGDDALAAEPAQTRERPALYRSSEGNSSPTVENLEDEGLEDEGVEDKVTADEATIDEAAPSWAAPGPFDARSTGEPPLPASPAQEPAAREQSGEAQAWLARLNADQRAAVECIDAPLVIVAGPGAGKTRTLTVRIAQLVRSHGVDPANILAITFTNKAAEEMAERLAALLGKEQAASITVKTFHAFGLQLLQTYAESLNLPPSFAIAGEEDRLALLRRALPALTEQEAAGLLEQISAAKNRLLAPDDPETATLDPALPGAYRRYQEALAAAHLLDFDDLLRLPVRLLESDPAALAAIRARYRWISVDEYQDVNLAQYRLLRLLAGDPAHGGANLCVIGDPDQAIYGFRGADHRYFLAFQQDYPTARTVYLRQSYRSPQSLLDAASQVIARAAGRQESDAALRLWSEFAEQVKVDTYRAPTDRAEAEYVVHRIEQMVGGTSYFSLDSARVEGTETGTRSFGDFAVLYRLNAQSRLLVEAFDRSGIPFQVVGQTALANHREVRALLALLWLRYAPQAALPLEPLLGAGRGALSPAQVDQVTAQIAAHGVGHGLAQASSLPGLSAAQGRRLARLAAFWSELAQMPPTTPVVELAQRVQAFLAEAEGEPPSAAQQERAARLLRQAAAYGDDLAAFLEAMALRREADEYDPRADRVTLLTLHAAKGLEFPVVFIVGCEEGLLPYLPQGSEASRKQVDVEEERRLFYVGMTRAQQKLILTQARRRFLFGREWEPAPSRFVEDIEAALKAVQAGTARKPKEKAEDLQLKLF
ncbi:MAG TPA: UvrD-helicase domain-containing protein [Caldilineaceae bacterium]|nr:UvrD-helicase domain-containing protein [Caldilineaceae bacterium]